MTEAEPTSKPNFCSQCGAQLLPDALFCHVCGTSVDGRIKAARAPRRMSPALRWGVPGAAILAVIILSFFGIGSRGPAGGSPGMAPAGAGAMRAPDISSMSPTERADRLFNHVMRLSSAGKVDSVAFFAPMALAAFEAISPMSAHSRYDMGMVALISGDVERASAQSDSILAERKTHLLGLALGARVAAARGDSAAVRTLRAKMREVEKTERASGLPEYTDHAADLRAAMDG